MAGVETSTGAETQASVEVHADGTARVTNVPVRGTSVDAGADPPVAAAAPTAEEIQEALDKEVAEGDKKVAAEESGEAEPKGETPEAPEPTLTGTAEDLGEYKADDPEVAAKFDARYFTEAGHLDVDALSAEFWGNAAADAPGKLHEGTYAYLAARLGVSKEVVQDIEAGLVAKHAQTAGATAARVHGVAGGAGAFNAALKWGNEGGYTPEQRARFDKLVSTQGEGWEDAVEALVSRHQKANPPPASASRVPPGPPQRRSTPARVAGQEPAGTKPPAAKESPKAKDAPPPAAERIKDADEYLKLLGEAKGDPAKMTALRARLAASPNVRM